MQTNIQTDLFSYECFKSNLSFESVDFVGYQA